MPASRGSPVAGVAAFSPAWAIRARSFRGSASLRFPVREHEDHATKVNEKNQVNKKKRENVKNLLAPPRPAVGLTVGRGGASVFRVAVLGLAPRAGAFGVGRPVAASAAAHVADFVEAGVDVGVRVVVPFGARHDEPDEGDVLVGGCLAAQPDVGQGGEPSRGGRDYFLRRDGVPSLSSSFPRRWRRRTFRAGGGPAYRRFVWPESVLVVQVRKEAGILRYCGLPAFFVCRLCCVARRLFEDVVPNQILVLCTFGSCPGSGNRRPVFQERLDRAG